MLVPWKNSFREILNDTKYCEAWAKWLSGLFIVPHIIDYVINGCHSEKSQLHLFWFNAHAKTWNYYTSWGHLAFGECVEFSLIDLKCQKFFELIVEKN